MKVLTPTKTYLKRSSTGRSPGARKKLKFEDGQQQTNPDADFLNSLIDLPDSHNTPRKLKLKEKIIYQTKKIKNYQKRLSSLKQSVKKSKVTIYTILPFLTFLSTVAKMLVLMQIRGNSKRRLWDKNEREFAISFFYKSPSAYKFLRSKGVILPAPSTIRGWIGQNMFKTGIDEGILKHLGMKCSSLKERDKKCIVAFDEMSIKDFLEYNKKLDIVEGFEDLGPLGRAPKNATQALVFCIKGIYSSWKIPISYFFSCGSVKKTNLKDLIQYNLKTLIKIGYIPKAIVCDQGSNNRGALNLLGVTKDRPYFILDNFKIFAVFDVPHLFKSVRNNWLSGEFKFLDKIFSFNVIKKTYEIDKNSQTARALPKITDRHINPNNFEKMSCSLALQLFSNSMAAAIKTCVSIGQIGQKEGLDTAEFILNLNNIFDALNSKRLFAKNPFNCGLSDKNPLVMSTILQGRDLFESLIKVSYQKTSILKESRPPCFDGMVQSINAIIGLFESEKQASHFLLTNRLNQDFLENFFSIVRQKGGWNLNPTAKAFRLSYRIQLITGLLNPPKSANCEEDPNYFQFLISTSKKFQYDNNDVLQNDIFLENFNDKVTVLPERSSSVSKYETPNTVLLQDCAVAYYAGYLIKTVCDKYSCNDCASNFQKASVSLTDPTELFLLNKNFGARTVMYLKVPAKETENMVQESMVVFKKYFEKYKHEELVATKIKNIIISKNELWLGDKNDKCYEHKMFFLNKMINTNMFKFCKWSHRRTKKYTQKIKNIQNL